MLHFVYTNGTKTERVIMDFLIIGMLVLIVLLIAN